MTFFDETARARPRTSESIIESERMTAPTRIAVWDTVNKERMEFNMNIKLSFCIKPLAIESCMLWPHSHMLDNYIYITEKEKKQLTRIQKKNHTNTHNYLPTNKSKTISGKRGKSIQQHPHKTANNLTATQPWKNRANTRARVHNVCTHTSFGWLRKVTHLLPKYRNSLTIFTKQLHTCLRIFFVDKY